MKEFKLIVAGGRDFNDADLLSRVLIAMADVEYADKDISIVSGMARGADALAYQFAALHSIQCYEFNADWHRHGKSAGYKRNIEMAEFSDGLLVFHDGVSNGTAHMVRSMELMGKPVTIVKY